MPASLPWSPAAGGVRVRVRLTPGARAERIDGVVPDADGGSALKVAVTAPPADGKANAALIALLAKAWKMPKSAIALVAGTTDRRKTLFVSGAADEICRRIDAALAKGGRV